jgi:outer membrane protein assembly factor BamB
MVLALAATPSILHESIASGMMGMMFYVYAVPVLSIAFVAGAAASRRLADGPRRAALAATIVLACGAWALLRTDGILGAGGAQFAWRWTPTAEERLLAQAGDDRLALPPTPRAAESAGETPPLPNAEIASGAAAIGQPPSLPAAAASTDTVDERLSIQSADAPPTVPDAAEGEADWPGFRGADRDGIARGARIAADWSVSPPAELWRRPVGPGWSSIAVRGDLLYTQEQRGGDEVVACYKMTNGEPVWVHRDAARFWESNAGAGPRATPAVSNGRVYTLGATGILNALDADDGAVVWSRNAGSDTGAKVPYWGFAGSPLVTGGLVIVATAGRLAAYELATGEPRWLGPEGGDGYSSPHPLTVGGVAQILLLSAKGAASVAPADGALLWEHHWEGFASLQPALSADGDILITTGAATGGLGMRRLAAAHGPGGWSVQERWTSAGLKPYYNDFVVHDGHAYGFDGSILACIDLKDGKRKWKGGRYGNGQLVLLPGQNMLLVLSEGGELALVGAAPGSFKELARFKAIEGKCWNHPVLAGDVVLVRNDQEMAAFRLARAGRVAKSGAL